MQRDDFRNIQLRSFMQEFGHTINDANDLLYANNTYRWFYGKRIQINRMALDALSPAIASNLAKGI